MATLGVNSQRWGRAWRTHLPPLCTGLFIRTHTGSDISSDFGLGCKMSQWRICWCFLWSQTDAELLLLTFTAQTAWRTFWSRTCLAQSAMVRAEDARSGHDVLDNITVLIQHSRLRSRNVCSCDSCCESKPGLGKLCDKSKCEHSHHKRFALKSTQKQYHKGPRQGFSELLVNTET